MAHPMIGDGRAYRVCDACGQVDDHPRHVIAGASDAYPPPTDETVAKVMANIAALKLDALVGARIVRDLLSTASLDLHMDCCRQRGCPTGACDQQTAGAESLRGANLLDHLVTTPSTGSEVAA